MIQTSKETDERRDAQKRAANAGDEVVVPAECWCLHGAVGAAADWRGISTCLSKHGISTRAVDLWRFLQCESVPMPEFGKRLNADAEGEVSRGRRRILIGYSMGARLAMHALLEGGPWEAAVMISGNPGLRDATEASARRGEDAVWASQALIQSWPDFLVNWNSQPILGGAIRDEREDRKLMQRRREIARSFVDWSLGSQDALWEKLSTIKIPILWIAGENDPKFRALAEEAAAVSEHFSLEIAPGSGHRVPWENEAWLVEKIAEFVS